MLTQLINYLPIEALKVKTTVSIMLCGLVIIAIILDLVMGLRRAKRLGIRPKSSALKRTIYKMAIYFACLLGLALFDFAITLVSFFSLFGLPDVPAFIFAGVIIALGVEIMSVWENSRYNDPAIPDEEELQLDKKIKELGDTVRQGAALYKEVKAMMDDKGKEGGAR